MLGAAAAAALTVTLSLIGVRSHRWLRCAAFAASGATAFGLASALMRLISLTITAPGGTDLAVGVAAGLVVALALLGGSWAVQQAHAAGTPHVVVACLTVIDPLVGVTLDTTALGDGVAGTPASTTGLIACAAAGLASTLVMAHHHPATHRDTELRGRPGRTAPQWVTARRGG